MDYGVGGGFFLRFSISILCENGWMDGRKQKEAICSNNLFSCLGDHITLDLLCTSRSVSVGVFLFIYLLVMERWVGVGVGRELLVGMEWGWEGMKAGWRVRVGWR